MSEEKIAELLLDVSAMSFRFDPPFTYTSGLKSPVYLDNRLIISYPHKRNILIESYLKVIDKEVGIKNIDWISATATAAIPLGAWIADRLDLPMVYVRSSLKGHGKENKMEGHIKADSRVLVIEDHISSANSMIDNINTIRENGGIVQYCMATTTYEMQESLDNIESAEVPVLTLTTGKKLIEVALDKGMINQKEKESIELWFHNPKEWHK